MLCRQARYFGPDSLTAVPHHDYDAGKLKLPLALACLFDLVELNFWYILVLPSAWA
jgi:hypothetical protein